MARELAQDERILCLPCVLGRHPDKAHQRWTVEDHEWASWYGAELAKGKCECRRCARYLVLPRGPMEET